MSPKSVHRYHCPHHLSKDSCVEKIPWRRDRLPTPLFLGFPGGSAGKESACNVGDLVSILGLGRSPGEGKGDPLPYSGLENSMDYIVHGVTKSWTQLSNIDFHFFGREACGILASQPGIELAPPVLEGEVLTTGQPEKSP